MPRGRPLRRAVLLDAGRLALAGRDAVRLLRPSVSQRLDARVVRLVDELPRVDDRNEDVVGRLFAHERGSCSRTSRRLLPRPRSR